MIEVKIITKEKLTKREEMWLMGKKADLLEALDKIVDKLSTIEEMLLVQSGSIKGVHR